jgi:hypothetical protein
VRFLRPALACALAAACLAPATAGADWNVFQEVPGNPANRLAELPIDDYRYDRATRCRRRPATGMTALQSWLDRNAGGTSWGIMRCEKLGPENYSLHAEGRALDWHLNVHNTRDRREAKRLILLLLAPDRMGNPHALARRMGIQEIIWDCKSWWSGSRGMGRYSVCYRGKDGRYKNPGDTVAHRDHIHFGLNWPGARERTTFWAEG